MVVHVDVLCILGLGDNLFLALDDISQPRVLHIVLLLGGERVSVSVQDCCLAHGASYEQQMLKTLSSALYMY